MLGGPAGPGLIWINRPLGRCCNWAILDRDPLPKGSEGRVTLWTAYSPHNLAAVFPNTHAFCSSVIPDSFTIASDRV